MFRLKSAAVAVVALLTVAPGFPLAPESAEAASPRGDFRITPVGSRGALLRPQQPRFPQMDAARANAAARQVLANRAPSGSVLRGFGFGRPASYPSHMPRWTGNASGRTGHQALHGNPGPNGWTSKPTGRQVGGHRPPGRSVDPQWRARQAALARQRLAWAQACVKSRPAGSTRDCNPPMPFETPQIRPDADAVILSDGHVVMGNPPTR